MATRRGSLWDTCSFLTVHESTGHHKAGVSYHKSTIRTLTYYVTPQTWDCCNPQTTHPSQLTQAGSKAPLVLYMCRVARHARLPLVGKHISELPFCNAPKNICSATSALLITKAAAWALQPTVCHLPKKHSVSVTDIHSKICQSSHKISEGTKMPKRIAKTAQQLSTEVYRHACHRGSGNQV